MSYYMPPAGLSVGPKKVSGDATTWLVTITGILYISATAEVCAGNYSVSAVFPEETPYPSIPLEMTNKGINTMSLTFLSFTSSSILSTINI